MASVTVTIDNTAFFLVTFIQCENILEDHEEDIVKFFKDEAEDSKNGFCINKAS